MRERRFISSALGGRPTVPYPNAATVLRYTILQLFYRFIYFSILFWKFRKFKWVILRLLLKSGEGELQRFFR